MYFEHVNIDRQVPQLKQINEEGTRYYVTPEGNKYPSVTTVLSEYSRKGIQEWRRRVGEETANKISRTASTRGTAFHKLCEHYLDNKTVELTTPLMAERFKAFTPLLDQINKIHTQELRMYSDHLRMAGTVDCIAEFEGRLSVIDFKTSSKPKDKDYIENYFMQCSAYSIMYEELFKIPVSRIVLMISVEDSDPQIFVEKRDNYVDRLLYYRDLYEQRIR